jgi:Rhodanese-like domain
MMRTNRNADVAKSPVFILVGWRSENAYPESGAFVCALSPSANNCAAISKPWRAFWLTQPKVTAMNKCFSATCDRYGHLITVNALRGDAPLAPWEEAVGFEPAFRLDVREPSEVAQGAIPGAIHIPIGQLRESLGLLPNDRRIEVYCQSGKRAHDATRLLRQHG